jgi:hypothetical protein
MSDRRLQMIKIDIPLDLAGSVAAAIYSHADMYRRDKGHSPEDIALICADADRMEVIAEELDTRAGRMEDDRRSAGHSDAGPGWAVSATCPRCGALHDMSPGWCLWCAWGWGRNPSLPSPPRLPKPDPL